MPFWLCRAFPPPFGVLSPWLKGSVWLFGGFWGGWDFAFLGVVGKIACRAGAIGNGCYGGNQATGNSQPAGC